MFKRNLCSLLFGLFLVAACGKHFENPNGNLFLNATVTASPLTVAADSLVTITGAGFSSDVKVDLVYFNGVGAAVLQASATQLVVKVPASGSTGAITVRVNGEQANGPVFTYPTGSVFGISPASGIGGTTVTLTGRNVGPALSTTVNFGNLPGKVIYTDSLRIVVMAPDSVKTSLLTINTNGKQYTGPVFNLCAITSISPSTQGGGQGTLTIVGTGFNPIANHNTVTFIKNPASRLIASDSSVVASVVQSSTDTMIVNIPGSAGTGAITVNSNGQNTITGPVFTLFGIRNVVANTFPFVVSSGYPQLLTGNGFDTVIGHNHLTVSGLPCTITYISPTADSIIFFPPDVINPAAPGTAGGALVLQSGSFNATWTYFYTSVQQNMPYPYEEVATLAGGTFGLANGTGKAAQFETLSGITAYKGILYVTDKQANNIRMITTDGVVTLVAGSPTGQAGWQDGVGAAALFNAPSGITVDNSGNLYVADSGNFRIRMINLSTYVVTTVSGTGTQGSVDGAGTTAQYEGPSSIVPDMSGPYCCMLGFYVMDAAGGQGSIRQLSYDGTGTITTMQSNLADPGPVFSPVTSFENYFIPWGYSYFSNYAFNFPAASFTAGVAGTSGYQDGAATSALFGDPAGIVMDNFTIAGATVPPYFVSNLLVSDRANNAIRAINLTYYNYPSFGPLNVITLLGGMGTGKAGYQDGGYRTALFNQPGPIVNINNNFYVCDIGNHAIRVFN